MRFNIYLITTVILAVFSSSLVGQEVLTLQETLRRAKENSPILKSEQFEIGIAEADLVSAKLRPNPVLNNESLQIMESNHFEPNSEWHSRYNREVLWQVSKPIQWMGQRKHKVGVAERELSLEERSYSEVERHLLLEVAEKWLEVWTAQKEVQIIGEAKENVDSLLRVNHRRYEYEVITKTELFRTKLLAKQYHLQYKNALQSVQSQQNELGLMLGINEAVQVDSSLQVLMALSDDLEQLIHESTMSRSDLQMMHSLVEVSDKNIQLQKSLAYPQPELGVIWNPQGAVPFLGFSFAIDLPFFDRNQGEIKKSRYLKEQAEHQLYTVEHQIQSEVTVAYSEYQLQKNSVAELQEMLHQAEIILENVKMAYLKGGTNIIDFLEAQRSWLETQQQHYESLQAYQESYLKLLHATGLINQLAL